MFGFIRGVKSPMKNIMNMVIIAVMVVFLVSRKIVEKKSAVSAMVPRCSVTIKNPIRMRSQ